MSKYILTLLGKLSEKIQVDDGDGYGDNGNDEDDDGKGQCTAQSIDKWTPWLSR